MPTPHINAKTEDIAKTVLMPGDPLRAKYIAEKFLTNVKLINTTRGMTAYTGEYNGKLITVFPHGMGIPSACIYFYELYEIYNVEKIIRIGTCGSNNPKIKLLDVILADKAFSFNTFPKVYASDDINLVSSTEELTTHIENVAINNNIKINKGLVISSDVFDLYVDHSTYVDPYPKDLNAIAVEMESFGLFYLAQKLNKQAAALLTVVDSLYDKKQIGSEDREKSLDDMIVTALLSII